MTKKHFIQLADHIRAYNAATYPQGFTTKQINFLADFCAGQDPNFNRQRWMDSLAGVCGPNGGKPTDEEK